MNTSFPFPQRINESLILRKSGRKLSRLLTSESGNRTPSHDPTLSASNILDER